MWPTEQMDRLDLKCMKNKTFQCKRGLLERLSQVSTAVEVGHGMTGSDPDVGGQPVTGADYLFLLFSPLCCELARQSSVSRIRFRSLFPGGLALIIHRYISDSQEITSGLA